MDEAEMTRVVEQVRALVEAHYLYPDVAAAVSRVLAEGVGEGLFPAEVSSLATAGNPDLTSGNVDKTPPPNNYTQYLQTRPADADHQARHGQRTGGGHN